VAHSNRALCRYLEKEAMMQTPKARLAFVLLVPAAAVNLASPGATAERNARGVAAYANAPDEWESAPDAVS